MSVYINMEMPEKQVCIILNPNGLVEVLDANNVLLEEYQAVPIPTHGRLIDADALTKQIKRDGIASDPFVKIVCNYFKDAPTIIPAEEGET
jgi:hypothetical protein